LVYNIPPDKNTAAGGNIGGIPEGTMQPSSVPKPPGTEGGHNGDLRTTHSVGNDKALGSPMETMRRC